MVSVRICLALASSLVLVATAPLSSTSGSPTPLEHVSLTTSTGLISNTAIATPMQLESPSTSNADIQSPKEATNMKLHIKAGNYGGIFAESENRNAAVINGTPIHEDPGNPGGFGLWIIVGLGVFAAVCLLALGTWYLRRKCLQRRRLAQTLKSNPEMDTKIQVIVGQAVVDSDLESLGSCETAVEKGEVVKKKDSLQSVKERPSFDDVDLS